jgi:CRP-like cAMP-binding protein
MVSLSFVKMFFRWGLNSYTVISDKAIMLTDTINLISLKSIRQCIIAFLRYEYHIQKNTVIKLNISKKDFAERLGIQRTSLNRELNKMRKDGLLEYDARTVTLKNIDVGEDWRIQP